MAYTAFSGDATQGTGSHLDVFIPELWADGIYRYFEKNIKRLTNRPTIIRM